MQQSQQFRANKLGDENMNTVVLPGERVLIGCAECGPELSYQCDGDQVTGDPETWAELIENLTGDEVPSTHDSSHHLTYFSLGAA